MKPTSLFLIKSIPHSSTYHSVFYESGGYVVVVDDSALRSSCVDATDRGGLMFAAIWRPMSACPD